MTSRIVVNNIEPDAGISSVTVNGGLTVTGVLKYEDVKNIDSIGIITARSTVSIADSIVHTGDTNTSLRFPATDTITAETSGLERLRIDSSGRLLLGRTTASNIDSKMEIQASTDTYLRIASGNTGGSAGVIFGSSDDHSTGGIYYANSNDTLQFAGYNNTTRMTITSGGKINIGDTDQTQTTDQFSVTIAAQNALDNVARFQSTAASSGTSESLVKIYKGAGYGGVISGYITQGSDHGLKFYTANNGSLSEGLRINSNGKITKPSHPSFYARRSIAGDGRAAASPVTEWQNPGSEANGNPNHNRGGHFNYSTGLFTAPVSGIYHFSACAGYKQTNVNFNQKFYHNGTTTAEGSRYIGSGVQSHSTSTISATMYMQAGNTMGVAMEYTHHANTTHNFFSGHLVG